MKKTLLFLLFNICFTIFSQENVLFRNIPWGSTEEYVIEKNGKPTVIDKSYEDIIQIRYRDNYVNVANYNAYVWFTLTQSKGLVNGRYEIFPDYNLKYYYISVKEDLKIKLTDIYGKEFLEKTIDDNFSYDYECTWRNAGNVIVILSISFLNNAKIGHIYIDYYSSEHWLNDHEGL